MQKKVNNSEDQNNKIVASIEKCITSLSEKFLKWPYNFFTESDAHSFLYYYIFRSGDKCLKIHYKTKEKRIKTVLIHREYPTNFRYRKGNLDKLELDNKGGRGHYDLVVLNPDFVKEYDIENIIAKNFSKWKKYCNDFKFPLSASIEFKLIIKPLDKNIRKEIRHDFQKLSWAIDKKHARHAYMIIFNRCREELKYKEELKKLGENYPDVKCIYLESIINLKDNNNMKKERYDGIYLNWASKNKLRFLINSCC